jgi:hypothetical protein
LYSPFHHLHHPETLGASPAKTQNLDIPEVFRIPLEQEMPAETGEGVHPGSFIPFPDSVFHNLLANVKGLEGEFPVKAPATDSPKECIGLVIQLPEESWRIRKKWLSGGILDENGRKGSEMYLIPGNWLFPQWHNGFGIR